MSRSTLNKAKDTWQWPHIGQRILKTTIAVFICLLVYWLYGYRGQDMPTEAAITAIICMQPYVKDSRHYALNRFAGTLIGVSCGLLFLLLLLFVPALGTVMPLLYALMALGVMLSLYIAVLVRMPDTSSLAAIIFICIVIAFPEIDAPLQQALTRISGVLIGTLVAITVNVFRLPRDKNRDCVFFVRTRDLAPNRFSQIPSAALFRLNYLYNDGAKICLMSEHAPAFFTLQMSAAMLNVPLIVMDGAAIYDAIENEYRYAETIGTADSDWLRGQLDAQGISYFIYTIHRNKTCIFHQGGIREQEKIIFERMKRSPYRSYLEGEIYEPEEIVYIKVIASDEEILTLAELLREPLQTRRMRAVVRSEAGAPGISGLYVYSSEASMKHAEEKLMELLRLENPSLRPTEVFLPTPYRSEHDAMHLLHVLGNLYEPVRFLHRHKKSNRDIS